MGADSAKVLLGESNQRRYREFTLNSDPTLSLPELSSVPWIGATKRCDGFKKEVFHLGSPSHIKFITESFLRLTKAEQSKQGEQWGIIEPESIFSRAFAVLGTYRLKAQEHTRKDIVSKSQALKTLFQARSTALHTVESRLNKNNTHSKCTDIFSQYIKDLQKIENGLDDYFADEGLSGLDPALRMKMKSDIQEALHLDNERARTYLNSLDKEDASHQIKFITKNRAPHAFLWQTNAEKLQQGVRWGIIKTQSITSKVIASLGQYRIKAHERATKGMVSNSQAVKLKLLDLYQDRFIAIQAVESLVNKKSNHAEFSKVFLEYIQQLQEIENHLNEYFAEVDLCGLNEQSLKQMKSDIKADRERAQTYLASLEQEKNLRPYNRARGEKSVLEFVKKQMIYGLYEFQGINQDMSYSRKRYFALTRGELNDFIEDARKEIDDHQADMRNAVTEKHHGIYSTNGDELFTYDFSADDLSAEREKHILSAISFIEGWDKLENKKGAKPSVSNGIATEELDTYAATRWRTHRNLNALAKSVGYFIYNIFKGIFVPTQPWDEEAWNNEFFHLNAAALRTHVKSIEPMWQKPVFFFAKMGYAFIDIFQGIRDFGSKLIIKMPEDIVNDWLATKAIPDLDGVIKTATQEIIAISTEEQTRLLHILKSSGNELLATLSKPTSKLAVVEYELSSAEQNDILNSAARGLISFSNIFSHNIYAKDPIGGLVFTSTYLIGFGMIYFPAYSASIFGSTLVNGFNTVSYAMASSSFGATIAGGSTLAEASAVAWDGVVHGPSGIAVNTFYQFGEDPLTIGAYCVAAYALGYFLANGIAGHQIPWLSELLQEDLGTDPSTGYPLIGAKFAVLLYEAFGIDLTTHHEQPKLEQLSLDAHEVSEQNKQLVARFKLALWLSNHAKMLPKLESKQQFALSQQLDLLFNKEESESLKKLIYPEKPRSIAFQIVSIPLVYIPAVLRFMISILLSFAAWVKDNPHPVEPMRRSGEFLLDKAKKDLSRIILFISNMVYLGYILMTPALKTLSYITTMTVGRLAGLFDAKPAHSIHKFFASMHNFMRSFGEFLYPARIIKSVVLAHPTDTILKTEASYVNLMRQMEQEKVVGKEGVRPETEGSEHFDFKLLSLGEDNAETIGLESMATVSALEFVQSSTLNFNQD